MSVILSSSLFRKREVFCIVKNLSRCVQHSSQQIQKPRVSPFRQYLLSRYMQYVQHYERLLEKRFPAAMHVYRVFMVGIQDFYSDLKVFLAVVTKVNLTARGLESLTRRELEIYHQMPKDMIKIAPVLLLSALPFANYVVFPLAYWFPRRLLTSHFWSLQQRAEFAMMEQKQQLRHNKPVFRSLQFQLEKLEDHPLYDNWSYCIRLLGSGLHPTPLQLIECKPLFAEYPYHLSQLYSSHLKELLKLHNMHTGWRRRKRLSYRARIIQLMDEAIVREGGVTELSQEEIRWACKFRGLNPVNMKLEDMMTWLDDWIIVSQNVDRESTSLLLHSPILLAYNHPSNWVLLH